MGHSRDSEANEELTRRLQQKCHEDRLRVMSIRWDGVGLEVEIQLDLAEGSFRPLDPFRIILEPALGLRPPTPSTDPRVVEAVADAFSCERLKERLVT